MKRAFNWPPIRAFFSDQPRAISPSDKRSIADAPIPSSIPSSVVAVQPVAQVPQEFPKASRYLETDLGAISWRSGSADYNKPNKAPLRMTLRQIPKGDRRDKPFFSTAKLFQRRARNKSGPDANPSNSFFGTNGVGPNDPLDKLFESYRGLLIGIQFGLGNSNLSSPQINKPTRLIPSA